MAERNDFSSNGQVIDCLIQSRKSISNTECSHALPAVMKQRLSNVNNNPTAVTACAEDRQQYCPNVQSSGRGELWKCLRKQLYKISVPCKKIVVDYMRVETEDYTLMVGLQKQCAVARKRFCKQEPDHTGHVVMCMMNHMHDAAMEPGCREKLVEKQGMLALSHKFNPFVARSCTGEVERLFKITKDANCQPYDDVMNGLSGRGLHCLTSHHKKLQKPRCKHAVNGLLRLQSNDLRAVPGMAAACEQAIKEFCQDVSAGSGRLHACLRTRIGKIKQPQCARMVNQTWKIEKQDATINPLVRARCKNEMEVYCHDVEHGEQRVLICLKHNENSTGFGEACKEAMNGIGVNPTLFTKARDKAMEVLKYLGRSGQFWDRWGIMLIGATGFLVLSSCLAVVVLLIRALRPRPKYGIEVEQGETIDQEATKEAP